MVNSAWNYSSVIIYFHVLDVHLNVCLKSFLEHQCEKDNTTQVCMCVKQACLS